MHNQGIIMFFFLFLNDINSLAGIYQWLSVTHSYFIIALDLTKMNSAFYNRLRNSLRNSLFGNFPRITETVGFLTISFGWSLKSCSHSFPRNTLLIPASIPCTRGHKARDSQGEILVWSSPTRRTGQDRTSRAGWFNKTLPTDSQASKWCRIFPTEASRQTLCFVPTTRCGKTEGSHTKP